MSVVLETAQFKTLHQIKKHHFESAQKTLFVKKEFLQKAESVAADVKLEHNKFKDFRKQEKTRLYQEEVERGDSKLGQISSVNYELQVLTQRLLEHKNQEEEAVKAVSDAQLELELAREHLVKSERALNKYDELDIDMQKQAYLDQERGQEKEYEDFQTQSVQVF